MFILSAEEMVRSQFIYILLQKCSLFDIIDKCKYYGEVCTYLLQKGLHTVRLIPCGIYAFYTEVCLEFLGNEVKVRWLEMLICFLVIILIILCFLLFQHLRASKNQEQSSTQISRIQSIYRFEAVDAEERCPYCDGISSRDKNCCMICGSKL